MNGNGPPDLLISGVIFAAMVAAAVVLDWVVTVLGGVCVLLWRAYRKEAA